MRLKNVGKKIAVSDVGHSHFINISALNTSLKDLMQLKKIKRHTEEQDSAVLFLNTVLIIVVLKITHVEAHSFASKNNVLPWLKVCYNLWLCTQHLTWSGVLFQPNLIICSFYIS